MGTDCSYEPGASPPIASKACYATYAMADYLTSASPPSSTRLALNYMSLNRSCGATGYETPAEDLTQLPVAPDSALVSAVDSISFAGGDGLGTRIEAALHGLVAYTAAKRRADREVIGVLLTDGDPNKCETDPSVLRQIVADHYASTGIRTFVIGMNGADETVLDTIASGGGGTVHDGFCGSLGRPCHFWSVGNGSGDAIAQALQAIARDSAPLPCSYAVGDLQAPPGEALDYGRVNVSLFDGGDNTRIGQVSSEEACPGDGTPAWFYDDPDSPSEITLCPGACGVVQSADEDASVSVSVGCEETVVII